jgi:hypothetical protein
MTFLTIKQPGDETTVSEFLPANPEYFSDRLGAVVALKFLGNIIVLKLDNFISDLIKGQVSTVGFDVLSPCGSSPTSDCSIFNRRVCVYLRIM